MLWFTAIGLAFGGALHPDVVEVPAGARLVQGTVAVRRVFDAEAGAVVEEATLQRLMC